MEIEVIEKSDNRLVIELKDEDHTLANMIRELAWKFGGEAAYRVDHPLISNPKVKIVGEKPVEVLRKVGEEIEKLAKEFKKEIKSL